MTYSRSFLTNGVIQRRASFSMYLRCQICHTKAHFLRNNSSDVRQTEIKISAFCSCMTLLDGVATGMAFFGVCFSVSLAFGYGVRVLKAMSFTNSSFD
jgi:hypothetical protein